MADSSGIALVKVGVEVDSEYKTKIKEYSNGIIDLLKGEVERISSATWDGFKDYSRDTSKDVSKTWESTTKDMKNLTAKSLWGTVSAWFDDDMDQVENIWDNAWNSMIVSADKAWDGLPDIVARRLQRSRRKSQGPEVFPGALALGTAA